MAIAAGYPVNQIQFCSHFKRVHYFILEAWEAIYRTMLSLYLAMQNGGTQLAQQELVVRTLEAISAMNFSESFNSKVTEIKILLNVQNANYKSFRTFVQNMADIDSTWKFWSEFTFNDALAYIGLYLALRSGDWNLRMVSLKLMAPVFTAFDHPNYQKLISQHLADLLIMPPGFITAFKQGAFVVSIAGNVWHSVGIDEAHEMLINKECKSAITRPSPDYINRMAHYLPYRTKMFENARSQLLPEVKEKITKINSPFMHDVNNQKFEKNVIAIMQLLDSKSLIVITDDNRGLINPFCNKVANSQQTHDLLNFRRIGEEEFF